ncbi:PREDICTED: THAP domain-containing protein 1-like [Papilio polytes]|uniref:THAP domain-containing protein 1-like n=1 Tax=Papilio polytes TaxID=76194 RepID=UPI000675FCB4|nr:PREDICTED: THAP domain-containing protein 1-like [Papilio polytes]
MFTCIFCKTHYKKGSGISFHKFPKDERLHLWLKNMKFENFYPSSNDRICSKHFTANCFTKHLTRTLLKHNSIPTIFRFKTKAASKNKKDASKNDDTEKSRKSPCSNSHNSMEQDPLTDDELCSEIKVEIEENHDSSCSCMSKCSKVEQNNLPNKGISRVWGDVSHDHSYQTNTPTSTRKVIEGIQNTLKVARTRIKVLSQHVKRLKKNIINLKDTNKKLRKRTAIGDVFVDMLKNTEDAKSHLFKRMFLNSDDNVSHAGYPKELKSFSLTLYALSPQAYNFVRKKFNLALPHPRMLRSWRSALKAKSANSIKNNSGAIDPPRVVSVLSIQDGLEHVKAKRVTDSPYENPHQDGMEHENSGSESSLDEDDEYSGTESPVELDLILDETEHENSGTESNSDLNLVLDEMEQWHRITK